MRRKEIVKNVIATGHTKIKNSYCEMYLVNEMQGQIPELY